MADGTGGYGYGYNGLLRFITDSNFYDIWGSSSNDVFAVGGDGSILHYDGNSWSAMSSGTVRNLKSVWGSSSSDVFAVGNEGTILHYDGTSWTAMTTASSTSPTFFDIWGSSSSDVFAVGSQGSIMHYDSNSWSAMFSGTVHTLKGIDSGSGVFTVGDSGTILGFNVEAPTEEVPTPTEEVPAAVRDVEERTTEAAAEAVGEKTTKEATEPIRGVIKPLVTSTTPPVTPSAPIDWWLIGGITVAVVAAVTIVLLARPGRT